MQEVISADAPERRGRVALSTLNARVRKALPTQVQAVAALLSGLLLVLAFPDFDLWPLAWFALMPLFYVVARRPSGPQAFTAGWITGTLFFYASCYWLTYPMIHYAGLPAWIAYPLFLPAPLIAGLFPALAMTALARACRRWGTRGLLLAPVFWVAFEWARLGVIGQLWNAVGYSQAYVPELIQAARYGGVYAVSFLVVTVNAALAYALPARRLRPTLVALGASAAVVLAVLGSQRAPSPHEETEARAVVIAVQPNVIPDFNRPAAEYFALTDRHFEMSARALREVEEARDATAGAPKATEHLPRVVVWPESPMNFSWGRNRLFRERVEEFTTQSRASLLFNALEPALGGGGFNAAVLVDTRGRLVVQYDKIRLMPFGEYVPLPSWMPGSGMVRGIVGDFTPGTRYTLMPLGDGRQAPQAGVFICIESAYPDIARRFAAGGADVLINITNDAYQGDTAVMRQHLANSVFRAVETGRPLLRVTNTGITARITPRGEVTDATTRYTADARAWTVGRSTGGQTFYVRYGDLFVMVCAALSLLFMALTVRRNGSAGGALGRSAIRRYEAR